MAFSATGAQAEGVWLILNASKQVKTGTELPAILELEKDKNKVGEEHYVLHSEILKIKILFLCTGIKLVNAIIYNSGAIGEKVGVEKGSKILFSECETFINNVLEPNCPPTDPIDGKKFIVTKALHGLLALHALASGAKDDILLIEPDEGSVLATIVLPAGCPIGTSVPVIGKLALQDCEGLALVHLVKHLLEPLEALTKLFTVSETAEHTATLLGSAWAKLGGAHAGLEWSMSSL